MKRKNNGMEKKQRDSNLEILRLLSMYMIVCIHANMFLGNFVSGRMWTFFNGLVNGICNTGVTCFILISGFYGIRFDLKKLMKMECMMISFSLLEMGLLYIFQPQLLEGAALLEQAVKTFFPFMTRKYWFYSSYVCIFLASSYIDRFIDSLSKEKLEKFILGMIVIFSLFPTFFYFEVIPDNGKGLVYMFMVYLIGRYIHKYKDTGLKKGKALAVLLLCWLLNGISHEFPIRVGEIYHHLCKDNSFTNLIIAVILFYLFKELKIKSGVINRLSSYLFAVFALNNSLVLVVVSILYKMGFQPVEGFAGFVMLLSVNLFILLGCLGIGGIREIIWGRAEVKLCLFMEGSMQRIAGKITRRQNEQKI